MVWVLGSANARNCGRRDGASAHFHARTARGRPVRLFSGRNLHPRCGQWCPRHGGSSRVAHPTARRPTAHAGVSTPQSLAHPRRQILRHVRAHRARCRQGDATRGAQYMVLTYLESTGPSAALNEAYLGPIRVLCHPRMQNCRAPARGKRVESDVRVTRSLPGAARYAWDT